MPPLQNTGNQRNLILFEVGYIERVRVGQTLTERITTIGLYPMYVTPTSIVYADTSRTPVTITLGALEPTRSGRNPYSVSLQGTFGVEARGVAPTGGTGEQRYMRFWSDVVRFGDAATRAQASVIGSALLATPAARAIALSFDPTRHTPYVNFFDLYNDRQFECVIRSFSPRRSYRNGGATGLVAYDLRIDEAGPIVASRLSDSVISRLLDGMSTWDEANQTLQSFAPSNLLASTVGIPAVLVAGITQRVDTLKGLVQDAMAVLGATNYGGPSVPTPGLGAFLGTARDLRTSSRELALVAQPLMPARPVLPGGGAIDWTRMSAQTTSPQLDLHDAIDDVLFVGDSAAHQLVAGAFFGLSQTQYQRVLTGADIASVIGGGVTGSRQYLVGDLDTPDSISAATGVEFERLIALNGLLPDEALIPGTSLQLPTSQPDAPQVIDGLPVFGSHAGADAWGRDLFLDMRVDTTTKDLALVSDIGALVQGIDWLLADFDGRVVGVDDSTFPLGVDQFVRSNLRELVLSDRRFASVEQLDVQQTSPQIDVTLAVAAINGGYVQLATGANT